MLFRSGQVFEMTLPASMEMLQAQVSGSLWKNIAYLRRRLDKQAPVTTERHQLSAEQAAPLLRRAALVEQSSWVARQGEEVKLVGEQNQAYWSCLAQHGDGPKVVLWLLSCGEHDIAFSLHLEYGQTMCIVAMATTRIGNRPARDLCYPSTFSATRSGAAYAWSTGVRVIPATNNAGERSREHG